MTEDSTTSSLDGIAIIGMAGRFPGADTLEEFWNNLVEGRETITTFFKDEIPAEEAKDDPDYVPRRGILNQPEWFDAAFFGINPKEAEAMDPQQRLFLEAAWHALEDAGCHPQRAGVVGVYAGMSNNSYFGHQVYPNRELRLQAGSDTVMMGNEKDYLATRVAYKLNLRGPALNIYTACSTSLVAVCQAVQGLLGYQCDVALAGGVSVKFPQQRGYLHQEGSIYSPDGHCRAFDEKSQGTVFSNGLGVVVLKRLEDALRDGDPIRAVIRGAALNNDGSDKVSFMAPSVNGHAEVISLAHALANVEPDTISYIECHGTATPIGDPIEIAGLTAAFREGTNRNGFCGIGSLKTNVGHMDAASGIGGLIKTALALENKILPASLHFTRPNPALGLESSPFHVVSKTMPWECGGPRRAGVSSFGVGGTNAHVVMEEAPSMAPSCAGKRCQILTLSAKSAEALEANAKNLAAWLKSHPDTNLADVAWTLQQGRQEFNHRRMLVAADAAGAAEVLLKGDARDVFTQCAETTHAEVAFLFPGQGSQHIRMGAALYRNEPVFAAVMDECCDILQPLLGEDLRVLLFPATDGEQTAESRLNQTALTQPALFVVEYALAKLLMSWGLKPSLMLGHSVGEYVAACLAGVLSLPDAVALVAARGKAMQACEHGAMTAVRLQEEELRAILPADLDIAAINAAGLVVVAGSTAAVEQFEILLTAREVSFRRLVTSHAFHSRLIEPALVEFRRALTGVKLSLPVIPYISNLTGSEITAEQATDPEYYVRHMRETVRFADGLKALLQRGRMALLEVGPGQALAPLARQHPKANQAAAIVSTLPPARELGAGEYEELMRAMGRLWLGGVEMKWSALHDGASRRKLSLPGYAFQRQRYCPDFIQPAGTQRDSESLLLPGFGGSVALEKSHAIAPPVATAVVNPAVSTPARPRRELVLEELRAQLQKLSGMDLSSASAGTSFLDLGFDSLFLTQAGLFLKKHFGLRITFRQLLEELNTMEALAAHLDENLPPEKFAPVVTALTVSGEKSAESASPLAARLALIEREISAMRQDLSSPSHAGASPGFRVRATQQLSGADKRVAFGPFRPIQTGRDGSLTNIQQDHLAALIRSYNEKTAGSKAFTQKHRHHFSDPRAVAGFNLLWKEAVYPLVTKRSDGSRIWDVDGNEYIDITLGFGLGLFGHRPKFVLDAVRQQLEEGFEIGPTSHLAGEVAELMCEFSGMERVSFCNTGSEALMAAIRTSRTVSGRDKIVMFAGAYHGIFDEVLVKPMMENGELRAAPIAPGIPDSVCDNILVLDYANPESLDIIREHGDEIAAVLVESVQSRRPDMQPAQFLLELREITREKGIALVFDEVVTGFRCHMKGAQAWFGIEADIATYGKVVGGGLPIGIIAGRRQYMDALDGGHWQYGDDSFPQVGVTFFAGTFIRHPLALAAARAVLLHLKEQGPALQDELNRRTNLFVAKMNQHCEEVGVPVKLTRFSSMFMVNIAPQIKHGELFFHHMRLRGIHMWAGRPSFFSTAHSDADIAAVAEAFEASVAALQDGGFFPRGEESTTAGASGMALSNASSLSGVKDARGAMAMEIPMNPAQQEMFLASHVSEEFAQACHESISLRLRGSLSPSTVQAALQLLVARHDSLRASFSADGTVMRIHPAREIVLTGMDFSGLGEIDLAEKLEEVRRDLFLAPFDLSNGPLLRGALAKLGEEDQELILVAHHVACDGWSFGVLAHEFSWACESVLGRTIKPLPAAASYADYAHELSEARGAEAHAEAKAYWTKKFAAVPEPLLLPCDGRRSGAVSLAAETVEIPLRREVLDGLKTFCRARGLTPFHAMLGLWQILAHRLSGSVDFVVGTPLAGQASFGMTDLCGHCVQFMPLRTSIDPSEPAVAVLERARRDALEATEHASFTLGDILQNLPGLRAEDRKSFVPMSFSFEPMPEKFSFAGIDGEVVANKKRKLIFELSIYAFTGPEGGRLVCAYRSDLYQAATIERWLGCYATLMESLLAAPHTSVRELNWLTPSQRDEMIFGFNRDRVSYDNLKCLHGWFEEVAAAHPQRIAVSCQGVNLTYDQLNRRANRLAHYLKQAGISRESLVGLCLDREPDLIVGILGILKAGGAYLPIDLSYPAERLEFMLEDARVPLLISQRKLSGQLPQHQGRTLFMDEADALLLAMPDTNVSGASAPDDLAYVIYTSGSTGQPKGCCITHGNVARLMLGTESWYGFNESDVWTLFHSTAFDFSVWEIWGALLYGGRLEVVPFLTSRNPAEFYQLLHREKVTVLNQTPSAFRQLIAAEIEALEKLPLELRYVIFGGEALEMTTLQPWFERHGDARPRLINMYGITETTVHVTYRPLAMDDLRCGSVIGIPLPDLSVYILDENRQPVPLGVPGEMYVGGAGLARGYLNRPELSAERFIADSLTGSAGARLYRTGDLARFLPGRDIEYLGRIDQQVKIRGFRIELGEIESVLATHTAVRDAVVVASADSAGDKQLCAYMTSVNGVRPGLNELRSHLLKRLPAYMVPGTFIFLESLPLTINGKLDWKALPQPREATVAALEIEYRAPRSDSEQVLAGIWETVLERKRISLDADFFAIGGTSLNALRMFHLIHQEFSLALPLGTVFRASTLEKLAREIDAMKTTHRKSTASPMVCIQPDGARTPLICLHGGDGGAMFYRSILPNMQNERPVYTIESPALVDESLSIETKSIEQAADEYLAMLKSERPLGPYILSGYSYGGVVAYEMACKLVEAGDKVSLLVLFDTENPSLEVREYSLTERIAAHWRSQQGRGIAGRILGLGTRFSTGLIQRIRTDSQTAAARKLMRQGESAASVELRQVQIREAHVDALESYRPRPYSGRVLLLRSDAVSDKHEKREDYGWSDLVSDLVIDKVSGDHLDIFDEPNVGGMAAKLRRHLEAY